MAIMDNRESDLVKRMFGTDADGDSYYSSYGVGSNGSNDNRKLTGIGSGTLVRTDPKPPLDSDGDPLTEAEILTMIQSVSQSRLDIDKSVRGRGTPQQEAERAKALDKHYTKLEQKLKAQLREAREYEKHRLEKVGGREYQAGSDEANVAITKMVDERVEWFHDQVQTLKEGLAESVRSKLQEIGRVSAETRDLIYDDLVNQEVIEEWEPLEL